MRQFHAQIGLHPIAIGLVSICANVGGLIDTMTNLIHELKGEINVIGNQ